MKQNFENRIRIKKTGFYYSSLNFWQSALFIIIFILEATLLLSENFVPSQTLTILKISLLLTLWWIPLVSGLANIFRNIYCIILWVIACILWIFVDFIPNFKVIPIITLGYIILMRFIFKAIYNKEPIFVVVARFDTSSFSKIENRVSSRIDFIFSMLTLIFGVVISIFIISK